MRNKYLWTVVQAVVTLALLLQLGRMIDPRAFLDLFARLPVWFYAFSLLVVIAGQVAYAWRWWVLLTAAGILVPFATALRLHFIGVFVSNFLPSTVGGDVVKVYYLGRTHGYRTPTASVLLDRVLGVGIVAALAVVALWSGPAQAPALVAARIGVTGILVLSAIVLGITMSVTGSFADRVAPLGSRVVGLARRLQGLRSDMAGALGRPSLLARVVIVVSVYFVGLTVMYDLFLGIQRSGDPSFRLLLGVVTSATVLSNVPVSLNGLGLREQLHVMLLLPLGVSPEVAVAISLLQFGHIVLASLLGLLLWLGTGDLPLHLPPAEAGA